MSFVELTKDEFEAILPDNFQQIEVENCKEFVYDIPTSREEVTVRVYSTVDIVTQRTRGLGKDAIRIVFWDKRNDHPIGKGKKILRVEGATTIQSRITSRIKSFLKSTNDVEIIDYKYVEKILEKTKWSDFANSLLESLKKFGRLTDRQLAFVLGKKNPNGRLTMEAICKKKDPSFGRETKYEEDDISSDDDISEETKETVCLPQGKVPDRKEEEKGPRKSPKPENGLEKNKLYYPTLKYKAWNYPFKNFNPVQSQMMPYRKQDCNLVIGANTSAGKTICAELIMDHVLRRKTKNRVVYLSPLKALTQEKYEDWQKRFPDEEITILTGDYTLSEKMKKKLGKSNIIVMTSEMCDSRTRKFRSEKNYWLNEVGLIIVDESHILTTSRGHAVECGLMRFSKINQGARIVMLSATMPNVNQLGEWLTVLNKKKTEVIYSTWRPVELKKAFVEYKLSRYSNGREDYWATQETKRRIAVEIAMHKPKEKFLIFTHDKGTGRNIIKRLEEKGVKSFFHSADLDLKDRLEVEAKFQDRENGIRVLVSTSTLAWGRNLPARNVIIVGCHRGLSEVDELDIIQMAGRAGRYGIDDEGFVYLIIPEGTTARWQETFENPRPVLSVLNQKSILAFHILSEIATKSITSISKAAKWYERSLAGLQNVSPFGKEEIENLFEDLKEMEMIGFHGINPFITNLGKVSALLYYSPYDIFSWYKNFNLYAEKRNEGEKFDGELLLSWALCDLPSNDWGYIPKGIAEECDNMGYALRSMGVRPSNAIKDALACFNAITGNKNSNKGTLAPVYRNLVFDVDRMVQALRMIDQRYAKWGFDDIWNSIGARIKYSIGTELIDLTKLRGVGGVKAKKLFELGLTSLEDIAKSSNSSKVGRIFPPHKVKELQKQAKELIKK